MARGFQHPARGRAQIDAQTREVAAELRRLDREWSELRKALDSVGKRRAEVEARYPFRQRMGDRVRQARVTLGISQVMLARLTGLHPSTISRLERGAGAKYGGRPSHTVIPLCDVLGMDFDELLTP
jgi:ribosome-binding protein aMBF1 (putative translation factor)